MDRTLLARSLAVGVLALLVGTSAAVAQDYYYTHFQVANQDYPLPPGPCLVQGSVQSLLTPRTYPRRGRRIRVLTPTVTPIVRCDPTALIGVTGLNECQWQARYPR
jgi:hypothetical protein